MPFGAAVPIHVDPSEIFKIHPSVCTDVSAFDDFERPISSFGAGPMSCQ